MEATLPQDEAVRLAVLKEYRVLDTPQESDFDDLVHLAAQICQVPISLVSLVDRDRQWFKGRYGLELAETPRRISFCAHSILRAPEPTVIPDASRDPRFADNELVTGKRHIRFYAAAPLVTPEGQPLGTLCVLDTKPRKITPEQQHALQILSRQVMVQLELRRRLSELERASEKLNEARNVENRQHQEIVRLQATRLHHSEERFRAIFEHAGLGIGEVDDQGQFLMVNDRLCQIARRSREELLRMTVRGLTYPEDRLEPAQPYEDLISGHRWKTYERRFERGDGSVVWVQVTISAIHDDHGDFQRGIVMVEDVSERKRFQQDLERLVAERTARLREVLNELEAFSYSLSHDMRGPLRTINSFTTIVLDECQDKLGEDAVSWLKKVVRTSERMDRMITDVLSFSRMSREEIQLHPVDVDELVRGIIQDRTELQPPNATVEVHEPLGRVMGHETSLRQGLTNLLGNAVKYVSPGTTPCVTVYSERNKASVRIVVADNGIGIARDAQEKIFDLFERLHSASQYEGTGIGLAIVKRAVERMGGKVGVESEPEKGSRFWIELKSAASETSQPDGIVNPQRKAA